MMIKKITTFALGLLLTAGLWAQSGNNEMYGHAVIHHFPCIEHPVLDRYGQQSGCGYSRLGRQFRRHELCIGLGCALERHRYGAEYARYHHGLRHPFRLHD